MRNVLGTYVRCIEVRSGEKTVSMDIPIQGEEAM